MAVTESGSVHWRQPGCCPVSERLAKQLSKKNFRFIGINWKSPSGKFLLSQSLANWTRPRSCMLHISQWQRLKVGQFTWSWSSCSRFSLSSSLSSPPPSPVASFRPWADAAAADVFVTSGFETVSLRGAGVDADVSIGVCAYFISNTSCTRCAHN